MPGVCTTCCEHMVTELALHPATPYVKGVALRPAVQAKPRCSVPQAPTAAMAPNIVLHHAIPTRSCRVAWLLEELGVPYTLRPVEFPTGLWTDEYKEENPNQM